MTDALTTFARALRHPACSEAQAHQLLTVFVGELTTAIRAGELASEPPPSELSQLEQLPDWRGSTLLAWALEAPAPGGLGRAFESDGFLVLRQAQLLGRLALAVEQALVLNDLGTAHRVCALLAQQWLQVRGTQLLEQRFGAAGELDSEVD